MRSTRVHAKTLVTVHTLSLTQHVLYAQYTHFSNHSLYAQYTQRLYSQYTHFLSHNLSPLPFSLSLARARVRAGERALKRGKNLQDSRQGTHQQEQGGCVVQPSLVAGCIYTCTYVHTYTYVSNFVYMYMYVYVCTCIHMSVYVRMQIHLYVYICI